MKNETKRTGRQWLCRCLIYTLGVVVLALGLTLNTKTGLGVSPVISIAYATGQSLTVPFSSCVFVLYVIMVLLQFIVRGKKRRWRDLLQLPFSMVFSVLLDVYDRWLTINFDALWQNILLLAAAVIFTGLGMCLTIHMDIVVNPVDGMTQALSQRFGREMGLMKNILDLICVVLAMIVDILFNSLWTSVGLGTVIAVVCTGRVLALCNRLLKKPMLKAAGMRE